MGEIHLETPELRRLDVFMQYEYLWDRIDFYHSCNQKIVIPSGMAIIGSAIINEYVSGWTVKC